MPFFYPCPHGVIVATKAESTDVREEFRSGLSMNSHPMLDLLRRHDLASGTEPSSFRATPEPKYITHGLSISASYCLPSLTAPIGEEKRKGKKAKPPNPRKSSGTR